MDTKHRLPDLYPETEPYETGILKVSAIHKLYWEQSGNPDGVPALFLHGGPGSGATPAHRRFFDPAHYRIIIVDQRGAGRSLPLGAIEDNTTPNLVGDLEKLRNHLGSIGGWFSEVLGAQVWPWHTQFLIRSTVSV